MFFQQPHSKQYVRTINSHTHMASTLVDSCRFTRRRSSPFVEHVASFFLDPYSRPENKRGGAWMDVCLGRSQALARTPVAYLTCNGSPPVGDTPSLMTFREVRAAMFGREQG